MNDQLLLTSYLKTLRLPTMLRECPTVARQCSEADASYAMFLQQLAELEVQHRQAQSIERRIKQAAFPVVKELSAFDFAAVPKLNKKRVLDCPAASSSSSAPTSSSTAHREWARPTWPSRWAVKPAGVDTRSASSLPPVSPMPTMRLGRNATSCVWKTTSATWT